MTLMTPAQTPSTDDLVKVELDALLARCARAGIPEKQARSSLARLVSDATLQNWIDAERKRTAALALTPKGQALQSAFELHQENERLRRAGIRPDETAFLAACLEYLRIAHRVTLGDTVEVHGWVKPRTVRLRQFRLSFVNSEHPEDAFMWFSGESVRNCPPRRATDDHSCPLATQVYKV